MMESKTFFSDRFYYTFGPHDASLRIRSGDLLTVVCPDSDNRLADGSVLTNDQRQATTGSVLFEGNPVSGPIYVEEVEPGDCLAVDILEIELDRDWGRTLLAPGHGLLSSDQLSASADGETREGETREAVPRHMYRWHLDRSHNVAQLENPLGSDTIEVPIRPLLGTIGVCPQWGQQISTMLAGSHGGNMDLAVIRPGSTLLLPVHQHGGLLSLGDIHAAQGHGEIVGGGIETSGKVNLRVRALKSGSVDTPRVITEDYILAIATDGDLRRATELAYSRLIHELAAEPYSCNRWDLYQLVSQIGILEVGGMVIPSCCTVAAGIQGRHLPVRCQEILCEIRGE